MDTYISYKQYIKTIILILTITVFSLTITTAYAISGACSHHGGVDYTAGTDYDGSVICRDGWRNSSVLSRDMGSNARTGYPVQSKANYETVRSIQNFLNATQNAGLVADGSYGYRTKQAVKAFQYNNGLIADGIAGPATIQRMSEIQKSWSPTTTTQYTEYPALKVAQCQADATAKKLAFIQQGDKIIEANILPKITKLKKNIDKIEYQESQDSVAIFNNPILSANAATSLGNNTGEAYGPLKEGSKDSILWWEKKLREGKQKVRELAGVAYSDVYRECLK